MSSSKHSIVNSLFHQWPLIFIICLACLLFLMNLSSGFLWQDEAQTALIAKTVLVHGIPLGTDGRNSFSQDLGQDYGKGYIWRFHPWFQFYMLAAFFALFGTSTLVARLPFALCGIATVIVLYLLAQSLWNSRRAGVFAAITLTCSVPFLILARQCRYYAPSALFMMLGLYGYLLLLQRRRYASAIFFISLILLFQTQYVHYLALTAAVIFHSLICRRDRFKTVLLLAVGTAVLNIPWIIWFTTNNFLTGMYKTHENNTLLFLLSFCAQIKKRVFPLFLIDAAALIILIGWLKEKRIYLSRETYWQNLLLLILVIAADLLFLSYTTPAAFFRCLAAVIPICCAISALVMEMSSKLVSVVLGCVLMLAVVWSIGPIPDYTYELTHRYEGPVEGMVRFLNRHAEPDDIIAVTYEDLPLKFYTRFRIVGGLAGEDLSPVKKARWIILRKYTVNDKDYSVRQYITSNLPLHEYKKIRINSPDIQFQNREGIEEHQFRTVENEDRVIIYQKVK